VDSDVPRPLVGLGRGSDVRLLLDPGGSMVAPRAIGHISQQDTFAIVVLV
jgi:hypothetical protein